MVFDAEGSEVARHQLEHEQIMTQPGWVEHDPLEIAERDEQRHCWCVASRRPDRADLAAIGVTNQRETTVVWNPKTGRPWYNAIVWQDTRTDRIVSALDRTRAASSSASAQAFRLPHTSPAPSSSGSSRTSKACARPPTRGEAVFGTIDTWVIWNLTGGATAALTSPTSPTPAARC